MDFSGRIIEMGVMQTGDQERRQYEHYMDTLVRDTDVLRTQLLESRIEGEKQGRAEGMAKGKAEGLADGVKEVACKMKEKGMTTQAIAELTGLTTEEIEHL